jgi:hypothetical protein
MASINYGTTTENRQPGWAGDYLDREHLIPGGARLDPAQFRTADAVVAVVGVAGAAQGATSVPVAALSGPIPSGTTLDFGTTKFAVLTAAAASGATSLTVRALVTALVSGDTATYPGAGLQKKIVVAGTLVGRTIAERDAGTAYGPAADADDEVYLIAFDVDDAAYNPDVVFYRPGSVVKENMLASFAGLSSTLKGKVRAAYICTRGSN